MIAGQGTIGLELAEQLPEVETVVIPIGGGGLASGIALALRATRPEVKLVGVQADACAPFAGKTEHGFTIAEGIAVKEPGELTSAILGDVLDGVVTVTDEEISPGDRPAARADQARRRRGRRRIGRCAAGRPCRGQRLRGGDPLGRQHRPDASDPGHAPRPDPGGAVPRRPHAYRGPPGRADQAPVAVRGGARQRRVSSSTTARG